MRNRIKALAVVLPAVVLLAGTTLSVVPAAHAASDTFTPRPGGPRALATAPLATGTAVPGVLLVTTTGAPAAAQIRVAAGRLTGGAVTRSLSDRVAQVEVPVGSEQAAGQALAAQPGVVAVEPAQYRQQLRAPNDPLYPRQWAHQVSGTEAAWDVTTGSAAVQVAVIDTGVDARHPDLRGNVTRQQVFAGGSVRTLTPGSDNRQCGGQDHGTHVAGIIGARGDDGAGVAGVAWNVSLLDFAVFGVANGGCSASDADILAAIRTATRAGADVINLSLGGSVGQSACGTAFQAVIDEARAAGVVIVAASGNSELEPGQAGATFVPASCNGVVSVGAVSDTTARAGYSTTNAYVDLAAPGGDSSTGLGGGILSTVGDGQFAYFDGTSMAAPYVSGLAALLRAAHPGLTPEQVEGLLQAGAQDLGATGRDVEYGWGLVDAGRSLALAGSGARPSPGPAPSFPVSDNGDATVTPPPSAGPQVYRVDAGTGATAAVPQAVAMSQAVFADGAAGHAVLARQDDSADALAGSSLGLGLGPLLFSGSTGPLPTATRDELVRVLPSGATVYLLGGPAALPSALDSELAGLGFAPVRLAGQTRERTAVAVAGELARVRTAAGLADQQVVLLATAANWPDAVTAGSLGAYFGLPILLTPVTSLDPATAQALGDLQPRLLIVLGGPAAVSDATYAAAAGAAGTAETHRVAGADRYATSVALAELFRANLQAGGHVPNCVIAVNLIRADGWAHALSASSLAGAFGCLMVPAEGPAGERLPTVTRDYVAGLGVDGILAGDTDLLGNATEAELAALLAG